jgi:hypothetical protein
MKQQPLVGKGLLITEASLPHTATHTTLGKTPLDEWSAQRKDLYLTTHNIHKRYIYTRPRGIRTRNPSKRAAANSRFRPRDQRNTPDCTIVTVISNYNCENNVPQTWMLLIVLIEILKNGKLAVASSYPHTSVWYPHFDGNAAFL